MVVKNGDLKFMIPRMIHYCWFGGNSLPESAQKCIASWKKHFQDYEIKEWNESNYDVYKIPYTTEAYNAKKYAFVSDYARFDILYQYGGIYFDVDVEVIKSFGKILEDTGFIGMEALGNIAAGLGVGCNAGLGVVKEILEHYAIAYFLSENKINKYNLTTVVERVTEIFIKKGFNTKSNEIQKVAEFTIYPPEYFAPKHFRTGVIKITENTYSIHHYDGSWFSEREKIRIKRIQRFKKILGDGLFSKILCKCYLFFINIFDFIRTILK
jgi:mannosyltransferase OCH1-like enzyme